MFDFVINPMITLLLLLYYLLGQNVLLSIIVFTVIVRMAILPLTLKQQRSLKNMQKLSPQLKELQKKYKDDREHLVQEQMALYKEHGVNPMAGCWPILIQLPILFGLWRSILYTLASTPDALLNLEDRILLRGFLDDVFGLQVDTIVPLQNTWMWLNLAVPDPFYILPVLVVITAFLQQKLLMPLPDKDKSKRSGKNDDPADQAAQMTRQMTTIMPFFMGFISLSYASGLAVYFVTSNIIGIIQYSLMGRADFRRLVGKEAPKEDGDEVTLTTGEEKVAPEPPKRQLKPGISEMRLSAHTGSRSGKSSGSSRQQRSSSSVSAKDRRSKRGSNTQKKRSTGRR